MPNRSKPHPFDFETNKVKVPPAPGVYFVFDQHGQIIYVGKSKCLRRRFSQYRNARRIRKHLKMRKIVAEGVRVRYALCATVLEAELNELRLIQAFQPRLNIALKFYKSYPRIRLSQSGDVFSLKLTKVAMPGQGVIEFGSFRSYQNTAEFLDSLIYLLRFTTKVTRQGGSYSIRGLKSDWWKDFMAFLRGQHLDAIEGLVINLADSRSARRRTKAVQKALNRIRLFWRCEVIPLKRVMDTLGWQNYPVEPKDRDQLFIEARHLGYTKRHVTQEVRTQR